MKEVMNFDGNVEVYHLGVKIATVELDSEEHQVFQDLAERLCIGKHLANICADWNMNEVEINGKMTDIYDIIAELEDNNRF
jgi:hypothetical protein